MTVPLMKQTSVLEVKLKRVLIQVLILLFIQTSDYCDSKIKLLMRHFLVALLKMS